MSWVEVRGLTKSFGAGVRALDAVSFAMEKGEFFCIVGPTNAGKSTLLKTIAGLYRPDAGQVLLGGRDVTSLEPKARHLSMLFQNIALFPGQTGFDNIAFPLRAAGEADLDIAARVEAVADSLKVRHVLGRYPRTFSGGEQQRVAIGRAIAHPAQVLMLDEPLTNLDARIRIALRIQFKAMHRDSGQTILYVTHDQVEAMSLSDRVAVLHEGRIQQIATPDEIYHRPANRFVAQFIGQPPMNILEAELSGEPGRFVLQGDGYAAALNPAAGLASRHDLPRKLAFGVRPEKLRAGVGRSEETPYPGEVIWIERLGAKHVLDVRLGGHLVKAVVAPDHSVGDVGPAWFGFPPHIDDVLDPQTGRFFR